jgi:AraC family transcriptional regulator
MAGMSISEYIRRRRLSQAVFDIQSGSEKIIDVALKYCYESPSTFTRAFKELHGTTPVSARKMSVSLKTYPPISFVLTIKGGNEMNFRIEKKDSFQIMGLLGHENVVEEGLGSLWTKYLEVYDPIMYNNGDTYHSAPFWQIGAYEFNSEGGRTDAIIGAEYKGKKPEGVEISFVTIPAATWAVFSINSVTGAEKYNEAYTRIIAEWFPASQYKRDESVRNLDVYPPGKMDKNYVWEIWMPVLNK